MNRDLYPAMLGYINKLKETIELCAGIIVAECEIYSDAPGDDFESVLDWLRELSHDIEQVWEDEH
jgi:hypothetical protein